MARTLPLPLLLIIAVSAILTPTAVFAEGDNQAGPKLYVFDCGRLALDDVSAFGLTNEETDAREMSVPCYVIENGGKRLLFDGGLPLAIAGQGEQTLPTGLRMTYAVSLIDQLAAMDLTPKDIDYIAFSHFHFDHVGAANAFTDATLLIQNTEYLAAFQNYESNPVFDYSLYSKLTTNKKHILNGDHDVFGDATVQLISAPGHTPGHQVLLIKLAEHGSVMLSGDLYHFKESRTLKRTPVFNTDSAQTLASMTKVENLLQTENAELWIEHVAEHFDTLKLAPAYYR